MNQVNRIAYFLHTTASCKDKESANNWEDESEQDGSNHVRIHRHTYATKTF